MKRHFLMKLTNLEDQPIGGFYCSEKLDGIRVLWDGGVSRGVPKHLVPWANMVGDDRFKEAQVCTGLWTQYGNILHAPGWWLDLMPVVPLDLELYAGRERFQTLISIVKDHSGSGWEQIKPYGLSVPSMGLMLADGTIDVPNYHKRFVGCYEWWRDRYKHARCADPLFRISLRDGWTLLRAHSGFMTPVEQVPLPWGNDQARTVVGYRMTNIIANGGEGVVLTMPDMLWTPYRVKYCMKHKTSRASEGFVTGYVPGQGKHKGRLGSLVLSFNGKILKISGFTDEERENAKRLFPIGTRVSFKYRELSDEGVPKEARYLRVRDPIEG